MLAQAQSVESNGQLMLTFGRSFPDTNEEEETTEETSVSDTDTELEDEDELSLGFYAHGTGFISLRDAPLLFGYFGPELTFRDANLKLLTGTFMTGDGGMSVITSVWYNQALPSGFNVFLEGDAYLPIDGEDFGHEGRQYFTVFALSWADDPNSGNSIGLTSENFLSEEDFFSAAVGPTFNFADGGFWLAYDFTPATAGDKVVILRLTLNL